MIPNKNWLNLNFYRSIWLAEESTKITSNPHHKLKTYLEIKVYLQLTDHALDRANWLDPGRANTASATLLRWLGERLFHLSSYSLSLSILPINIGISEEEGHHSSREFRLGFLF